MSHFRIPFFIPGVEFAVCMRGVFTSEQCDQIRAMGELIAHQQGGFSAGRIGTRVEGGEEDPKARVTDIVWLHPTRENDWVHHTLANAIAHANHDKFQMDLECFDGFQFSLYKPGGHYDWHMDTIHQPPNAELHRKLSISVMLTNPDEYEGGDLLINTKGNPDHAEVHRPQKGDIIMFYSFLPHKVTPVTKGERVTLVTWGLGGKFR